MSNLIYGAEARKVIEEGMEKVHKAVEATLGPKGRNVIIQRDGALPQLTKDGVTVARNVNATWAYVTGANLVKAAASKTNREAGDGTTTSTVLTYNIFKEGRMLIDNESGNPVNPVLVQRGIDFAANWIAERLAGEAVQVTTKDMITKVATVSANGDSVLGECIASAFDRVGVDGIIMVEDSRTNETRLDITEGMMVDRGLKLEAFANDPLRMRAVYEDPLILLYDQNIKGMDELMPLLEHAAKARRPLVIVCDGMNTEVLHTIAMNVVKNGIAAVVVDAPGNHHTRTEFMDDIAVVTGGKLVSPSAGIMLKNANPSVFGTCDKVIVTGNTTTFIGGAGKESNIKGRVDSLYARSKDTDSEEVKDRMKERIGRMAGAVAVLKVSSGSDIDRGEKLDRVEDAINATRAAMQEGIIPGGGSVLALISELCPCNNGDEGIGVTIVKNAAKAPLKAIVRNAGGNPDEVVSKILESNDINLGYNALTGEYMDMMEAGIIDPVKVTRLALLNAASVAGAALTTECIVDNQTK